MNQSTFDLPLMILAGAAAIGLSPYAALAAIGLFAYLGAAGLPVGLTGLAAPSLWGVMAGWTVIDGALSHFRLTDLVWNVLHTIARPVAALLFAAAVLDGFPATSQWLGSLGALLVALLVHISVLAVRSAARTAGPESWLPGLTAARLLVAALLMVVAVAAPWLAAAAAAVLVMAPLAWAPRLWGAAILSITAILRALTRPDLQHEWQVGPDTLPRPLRHAAQAALGPVPGPIRHCRATLARLGSRWPYWRGRLVVAAEMPVLFLHYRGLRPRAIALHAASASLDDGVLVETLKVEHPLAFSLCLGPDAPPGPAILTVFKNATPHDALPGTSL